MVILGLDYGTQRTGVAIGDTEVKFARPVETIPSADWRVQLVRLIKDEAIGEVVVGLPRGLDGQETQQTALARRFADEVAAAFGVPVHLQDEAVTSEVAAGRLGREARSKGVVDAAAAAIILQDYLGGLK